MGECEMKGKTVISLFLAIGFILLAVSFTVVSFYNSYKFNMEIGGHLKRAANSNTVELAKQEINFALENIKKNELTDGNTGVLFKTPSKDVGFWYTNIQASYDELNEVGESATQLEKTNLLMKLRETLTDEEGLIKPKGIAIFPYNALFLFWGWFGWIGSIVFGLWALIRLDDDYRLNLF